jgi:hypothetical protein
MKFYNAFGIKPTNTYVSAGTDYYIPNLTTEVQIERAYKAFEKSYGVTDEEIKTLVKTFEAFVSNELLKQIPNLIHLYFALYDKDLADAKRNQSVSYSVNKFLSEFVIYDEVNNKIGIRMQLNDTLFINSGIKIALDTVLSDKLGTNTSNAVNMLRLLGIGVAGLYVNKSGNGNRGWDVRACLVDEDYSGFVHLSQAYTKELIEDGQNIVYCGDKLTQMMLIPVFHDEYVDTDEDTYNKIMGNSKRGDKGFGSSDVKH